MLDITKVVSLWLTPDSVEVGFSMGNLSPRYSEKQGEMVHNNITPQGMLLYCWLVYFANYILLND